jgi:RHS repeat-associated protein
MTARSSSRIARGEEGARRTIRVPGAKMALPARRCCTAAVPSPGSGGQARHFRWRQKRRLRNGRGAPLLQKVGQAACGAEEQSALTDERCGCIREAANELIEVRRKSDNFMLGTYTNDAFGRRVLREYWDAAAGGYKTLRYVYDSWQIAAEYLWDGLLETFFARIHYGNGIDEPLAMMILDVNDVNGNFITNEYLPYAFHRDTLGTITHLTDETGEIVERYECTPFGKTTIYTGTGPDGLWNTADDQAAPFSRVENNVIFQARERDAESGLYRFGPRCYSAEHGRFLQRDSEGDFSAAGSLGNGYDYCIPGLAGIDFALRLDDIVRAVGKKLKEAGEKVREWILALIDRKPDKSEEELRKERRRLVRDHFRRLYWKAVRYWGSRLDWRWRFWQEGKDSLKGEGPHFNNEHTEEEWDQKRQQWDTEDRNRDQEEANAYRGALEKWKEAADSWEGSTEDFSEAMKADTKKMDDWWSRGPEHDFWGWPK